MARQYTTEPYSSQMHSSHHSKGGRSSRKGKYQKRTSKDIVPGLGTTEKQCQYLPPSCITQALSIHLAHVAHANDADCGIFLGTSHLGNDFHLQLQALGSFLQLRTRLAISKTTEKVCREPNTQFFTGGMKLQRVNCNAGSGANKDGVRKFKYGGS